MQILKLSFLSLILFGFWQVPANAAELQVDIRFSSHELSVIRGYYDVSYKQSPSRKKKHNSLPPGIAKNLRAGKPLPPGIAKQALPADLHGRLPPVADGYERIIVAGKILLIDTATHIIHDILSDAIL